MRVDRLRQRPKIATGDRYCLQPFSRQSRAAFFCCNCGETGDRGSLLILLSLRLELLELGDRELSNAGNNFKWDIFLNHF
jgi:hypothetical protein